MKQKAVVCGLYEIQEQIDLLAVDGFILNAITPVDNDGIIKVILIFVNMVPTLVNNN
jgi:hypothetical protein